MDDIWKEAARQIPAVVVIVVVTVLVIVGLLLLRLPPTNSKRAIAAIAIGIIVLTTGIIAGMNEKPRPTTMIETQNATTLESEAIKLMREGKHDAARHKFAAAIAHGADTIHCLARKAECDIMVGDHETGIREATRLIFEGNAGRGHYLRGISLLKRGLKNEAKIELESAKMNDEPLAQILLDSLR